VLFSFLYMILRGMFRLVASGDEREREIEILVLRHQIKVLGRKAGRPKLKRLDKVLLAAAARCFRPSGGSRCSSNLRRSFAGTGSSSGASGPT
jgi:hypothetical protein